MVKVLLNVLQSIYGKLKHTSMPFQLKLECNLYIIKVYLSVLGNIMKVSLIKQLLMH